MDTVPLGFDTTSSSCRTPLHTPVATLPVRGLSGLDREVPAPKQPLLVMSQMPLWPVALTARTQQAQEIVSSYGQHGVEVVSSGIYVRSGA